MSASKDEWLSNMEELLVEDDNPDTWLHFTASETPDYMFEHWQNQYEVIIEDQKYLVDAASYGDRL